MHTREQLNPEIAFKLYKLPGIDQISAELVQAEGNILRSAFHKLIHYIWNKENSPQQWKKYIIVPTYKSDTKTNKDLYMAGPSPPQGGRPTKGNTEIFFQDNYGHDSQLEARGQDEQTD
jgi:hypothetical protein